MAFLLITAHVADDAYSFPGTGKVWVRERFSSLSS